MNVEVSADYQSALRIPNSDLLLHLELFKAHL